HEVGVSEGGRETTSDGDRDGGVEALPVLVGVAAVGRRPSQAGLLPDLLAMLATLIPISGLRQPGTSKLRLLNVLERHLCVAHELPSAFAASPPSCHAGPAPCHP